jgi:hypothetical protein
MNLVFNTVIEYNQVDFYGFTIMVPKNAKYLYLQPNGYLYSAEDEVDTQVFKHYLPYDVHVVAKFEDFDFDLVDKQIAIEDILV